MRTGIVHNNSCLFDFEIEHFKPHSKPLYYLNLFVIIILN